MTVQNNNSLRTVLRIAYRKRPNLQTQTQAWNRNGSRTKTRNYATEQTTTTTRARVRSLATSTLTVAGLIFGGYYYSDSRAAIHTWLAMPLMHLFTDAETSHNLAIKAMKMHLTPSDQKQDDECLSFDLWDKHFDNPIGLAAGLDKQGEAIDQLFDLGFAYVEIGTVTPNPQPGNDKPRYFRLYEDRAAINRYGFNSDGHARVAARLRDRVRRHVFHVSETTDAAALALARGPGGAQVTDRLSLPRSLKPGHVLAVNLGKNKDGDEIGDYVSGVARLGPYADILVINVSSPNTPGLRTLQHGKALTDLLSAVVTARDALPGSVKVPVLVKIAPDLTTPEIKEIARGIKATKVDGCIVSNTTISRPVSLVPVPEISQAGGLSGPPLKELTLRALRTMKTELGRDSGVVLVACGGVSTGRDVLEYGEAGASFVQAYTAFGYDGVRFARRIKDELVVALDGRNWRDISGLSPISQPVSTASRPLPLHADPKSRLGLDQRDPI